MNSLLWYAPFIQPTSCITHSLFAIICLLSHFQQVTAASMATCSDNEIMNIMFLFFFSSFEEEEFYFFYFHQIKQKRNDLLINRMYKSLF